MKGAGYAIEAIISMGIVLVFVFGTVTVPEGQNWSNFRSEVSATDLTYTFKQTGYIDTAMRNGETGSLQTAFEEVTETDAQVSGLVANLPINENRIAFYTKPSRRYTVQLQNANSCGAGTPTTDLEEIEPRSEEPVLENVNPLGSADATIYVADLDPREVGGNGVQDYDSIWVDNGTRCQFSNAEGPYYVDEIFGWGNYSYDSKWIDGGSQELRLYNATQPANMREVLNRRVNGVKTFTTVDTANFSMIEDRDYDTVVFRTRDAVDDIDSGNQATMRNFMSEGSMLVAADLTDDQLEAGDFLNQAGFQNVSVPYNNSYAGGEVEAVFTDSIGSRETETYFLGLNGDSFGLSLKPPGKVVSGTSQTLQSSQGILKAAPQPKTPTQSYAPPEAYNFTVWNTENTTMEEASSVPSGAPESDCYSPPSEALTEGTVNFPESGSIDVINAELGDLASHCNTNNDRAVKLDLDADGDYGDEDEGPYLNMSSVVVDNRRYSVVIGEGCSDGDCVYFRFIGDSTVEVVPRRTSFPGFFGERMALVGYEESYEEEDKKALASVIYWLRGDQVSFTAEGQGDISTNIHSGISQETYMPYEVNLQWQR